MLHHLRITDFGIIEEVELALASGLNVLTGETGAGKSMIVGAVSLLKGGRGSAESVRKGAKEAVIEAVLAVKDPGLVSLLEGLGLPEGDGELLIRRVVPAAGRGRIYVNGALCTAQVLSQLMGRVLDISGQHEFQALADRAFQRQLLDAVALNADLTQSMSERFSEVECLGKTLASTRLDDRQRVERLEFLRFQLRELELAELRPGEEAEVEASLSKLRRASDLIEAANGAAHVIYSGDRAVTERLARVHRPLAELASVDGSLGALAAQVDEARILLEDAGLALSRYAGTVALDPGELGRLEERGAQLHRLRRKHAATIEQLIERQDEIQAEIEQLDNFDQHQEDLEAELERARAAAGEVARDLSRRRKQAARRLSRQISSQLGELGMGGAEFEIRLGATAAQKGDHAYRLFVEAGEQRRMHAAGWDRVEMLVTTNPGEDPRPVGRVASGGELSRIMLAVRQVMGRHDPTLLTVFDEVDAGVGGAVADVVGCSLAAVGQHQQALVVTHLPQVAAYAERHFLVGKGRRGKRTTTRVETLDESARVEELARMLGASRVSEAARANARQLLVAARAACALESEARSRKNVA
ncbi:MAG: DNA repair protein RecN [Deltaproteobacteria bacterium]|nr:DNA repair protein RecN [Deltaproteobacteria bacterium]